LNISGSENGTGYRTIRLRPSQLPADLKLDPTGWLFCRPHWKNHLFDIPVRIRDKYNQTAMARVYISTRDIDSAGILMQNFPNPFTQSTTLSFEVPETSGVELAIFDLQGRKVRTLIDQELRPGLHQVIWQGDGAGGEELPPGLYLCRIVAGDLASSIRMVKMRY